MWGWWKQTCIYTPVYHIFVYKNDKRIRKQYNYQYKYTSKKGEQKITKSKQLWFIKRTLSQSVFFFYQNEEKYEAK